MFLLPFNKLFPFVVARIASLLCNIPWNYNQARIEQSPIKTSWICHQLLTTLLFTAELTYRPCVLYRPTPLMATQFFGGMVPTSIPWQIRIGAFQLPPRSDFLQTDPFIWLQTGCWIPTKILESISPCASVIGSIKTCSSLPESS